MQGNQTKMHLLPRQWICHQNSQKRLGDSAMISQLADRNSFHPSVSSGVMRFSAISVIFLLVFTSVVSAQDDYYLKKAMGYQREAEYYQKKAEGYRREAEYYLKKAEGYQKEAAYYTKKGKIDNARTYTRYADTAMDKYKTQMRYAAQADEKSAQYLRWAADALSRH